MSQSLGTFTRGLRAHRRLAAGAAWLLLAASGCSAEYTPRLEFASAGLAAVTTRIEARLMSSCDPEAETIQTLELARDVPSGAFGVVPPGEYALRAEAYGEDGCLVADGCRPVTLAAGGRAELRVELRARDGCFSLALGSEHGCYRTADTRADCWGRNGHGHGIPTLPDLLTTPAELRFDRDLRAIEAEGESTCALFQDGTLSCWGDNRHHQLSASADGGWDDIDEPAAFPDVPPVEEVTLGPAHLCVRVQGGDVWCRGNRFNGRLGVPSGPGDRDWHPVDGLLPATDVCAGEAHTCAVVTSGAVWCWGLNTTGQLGDSGSATPGHIPRASLDLEGPARRVVCGDDFTCALLVSGDVQCWGRNNRSQVGTDAPSAVYAPIPTLADAADVVAGAEHACAVTREGRVRCWGDNRDGQLGRDLESDQDAEAVDVPGVSAVVALAAGEGHTCATLADGQVWCWGRNTDGQLGVGTTLDPSPPAPLLSP